MTARRALGYALAGLLAYGATALAILPASWLSAGLEKASQHTLSLRDPSGTLWRGSGRLVGRGGRGAWLDLGPLRWSARPAELLRGRLSLEVRLAEKAETGVEITLGSVTLQAVDVEFPGALLAGVAPGADTVGPEGRIRIRSDRLRIDPASLVGSAEVEWRDMHVTRPAALDLGSHVARLRGTGKSVDIDLVTLDGPLRVVGTGSWTREKGLELSGKATPIESAPPALAPFLKGMCAEYRDASCVFHLRY